MVLLKEKNNNSYREYLSMQHFSEFTDIFMFALYNFLVLWQRCFLYSPLTWLHMTPSLSFSVFCYIRSCCCLYHDHTSRVKKKKKDVFQISGVGDEGGCVSLTFLGTLVSLLCLIPVLSEACGGSKLLEDTLSENYLSSSLKIYHWCWATKLFSVILLMS